MMNVEEIREYLLDELKDERQKMLMNKENHYSYIFMLCNDMGFTPEATKIQNQKKMKMPVIDIVEELEDTITNI